MSLLSIRTTDERSFSELAISGTVIGIVTNNKDPEQQGRVKLKFPALGEGVESHWARIVTPMAGKASGFFFLPEVDAEVLVVFEQGDLRLPLVLGALWNGEDKPPDANADGKNNLRIIKSRSGHSLIFNDEEDNEQIQIKAKSGHAIELNEADIKIVDKQGNDLLSVDTKTGTITVTAKKDLSLSAQQGTIKIEAQQIEVTATANAKIQAGGNLDLKGALVNIN